MHADLLVKVSPLFTQVARRWAAHARQTPAISEKPHTDWALPIVAPPVTR
ncbi:hypothetical protein RK21_03125 [Pseudomonas plecoglossicida]|nr:hypothetical protein RK21_03125 [Pseudomonas plecoglossicida]